MQNSRAKGYGEITAIGSRSEGADWIGRRKATGGELGDGGAMAGDGNACRSSWIPVYGPRGSKPRAPVERGDDAELTTTNYDGKERTKAAGGEL